VNEQMQYMGRPCRNGHGGLRWRANRTCVECKRKRDRERVRKRYANDPLYRLEQIQYIRRNRVKRRKEFRLAEDQAY
jgi:hypothetical protein